MLVTLEEMKNYLRVDFDDDDGLISHLIDSSHQLCMDVARLDDADAFAAAKNSKIAVMYEVAAAKVRSLYENYLSGLGLKEAASKAGIETYHGTAKRIMSNRRYLGDDYYPAIIDRVTFHSVQIELRKRAGKLGRLNKTPPQKVIKIPTSFTIADVKSCFDDPIMQAEYIYSLIESEVS